MNEKEREEDEEKRKTGQYGSGAYGASDTVWTRSGARTRALVIKLIAQSFAIRKALNAYNVIITII